MDLFLDGIAIEEYIHSQHRPHSVFPVAEFALFCVRTVPDEKCKNSALQAGQIEQLFPWRCMLCTINQCNADIGQVCQSNIYIHIVGLIFTFSFSSEEIKEMTTKCILCYDLRSEEHTLNSSHSQQSRMPSSA